MRHRYFVAMLVVALVFLGGLVARAQMPASPSGAPGYVTAGPSNATPFTPLQQLEGADPRIMKKLEALTPEQRALVESAMKEKGELTPQALEALRTRPEFQGLSLEEIMEGKRLLEGSPKEERKAAFEEPTAITPPKPKAEALVKEIEEESLFERYRKIGAYSVSVKDLKVFGSEFFKETAIKVLLDRKDIPVPEEYIIGPGDEVKVVLWGRVSAQYNLVVDRNGNISMPQLGPIRVAGMTFKDMSAHLIEQTKQIVGANIDVTMGSLKSIPVFILGDVKRPGAYMVGPFATITDALLYAGGPNNVGSMRKIELRRNDKLLTEYDLYDLFLKGDKSKDMNLQAGDVIFVPVCGPLVGVAGNVKRPAIYELKGKRDLKSLLEMAGGVIPSGDVQRIQVERIKESTAQVILDIGHKDFGKAKDFLLQDGDLVKVFPIVDWDKNAVYLFGNVKRPGKYELKPHMRIGDILKTIEDLLPDTHFDYALVKRLRLSDLSTELIPVNLGKIIFERNPAYDVDLAPWDKIYVFSKWFFRSKPYAEVLGEVRSPGKYELTENTTIKDLVLQAKGLTRDAYLDEAELYRTDVNTKEVTLIRFNLKDVMEGKGTGNLILKDMDKVVVHSVWEVIGKRNVTVKGEVDRPGVYQYADNMTVRDLVFAAGNVLESAYLKEAELARQVIKDGKAATYEYRTIDLGKALEGDPEHNLKLFPYDILFVKKLTDWQRLNYVTVTGEIAYPGKYVIKPGERLSSLIERAGGYTENAHLRGAVFTREDTRVLQQRSLDEMVRRLERELIAATSTAVGAAASTEEMQAQKAQAESVQRFISSLRGLQATGRMTVHLAPLRLLRNSEYDIELQDGDKLHIPSKNEVINVVGAVMSQGSFVFRPDFTWKNYIHLAGGYANYADTDNVYIMKVDGSAIKVGGGKISWNPFSSRWEFTAFGEKMKELEPGDTIVVPEKLTRIAWMREIKDITQILMQMTLTAGTVIKVF